MSSICSGTVRLTAGYRDAADVLGMNTCTGLSWVCTALVSMKMSAMPSAMTARHDRGWPGPPLLMTGCFVAGRTERMPWPATTFDVVVSTTSFDHWAN